MVDYTVDPSSLEMIPVRTPLLRGERERMRGRVARWRDLEERKEKKLHLGCYSYLGRKIAGLRVYIVTYSLITKLFN